MRSRDDMSRFLEPSPYATDDGELIGKDPRKIPTEELRALGHPESPIKAIRAKCLDCAGNEAEVRKCTATGCPLWPYRMGKNLFHSGRDAARQRALSSPIGRKQ